MEKKEIEKLIDNIKHDILTELISHVTILDVDVKEPFYNNRAIYVNCDFSDEIDKEGLRDILIKHNSGNVKVSYLIPTHNVIGKKREVNKDKLCFFINYDEEED